MAARKAEEGRPTPSRELLSALVDNAFDLLCLVSGAGVLRYVNPAAELVLGHPPEDLEGERLESYVHPDDAATFREALRQPQRTFEVRCRHCGGDWIFLEATTGRPTAAGIVLSARDVTERRMAREALAASEEKFRALFEESRDAICIGTVDGELLDVNPAALKLFGYATKEELLAKNIGHDLYWYPEDRRRTEAVFQAQGFVEDHEVVLKTRTGQQIRVQETATAIYDEGGEIIGFQGIMRDITDERRLEHQLRQSQKMEAVGRLANGVAHDFNNLLTAINGYSELLLARLAGDDPHRRALEEIRKAGRRAADITRRLLTVSRHQNVSPRRLDLNRVVEDMERLVERVIGEDVELRTYLDYDLQPIHADLSQIEQIFLNLVINARDAMPDGGQLVVETHAVRIPGEGLPVELEPGGYAQLVVTDSGEGMPPEILEHAFEPFFTTRDKRHNTGLGLAIVYGIVKQGGGHIEVESTLGTGTSLRLYFRLFVEDEAEVAVEEARQQMPRGDELVLLVEDEEPVRELVRQILDQQGYRVKEAQNAAAALEKCRELEAEPDLLLTDVIMPGQSGIELAEELKWRYPAMKILFMSGYTDSHAEIRRLAKQGASFLPKPFTPENLTRRIREVLDLRPRAEPEPSETSSS